MKSDGRNIDPLLGTLSGEGSHQRISEPLAPVVAAHDEGDTGSYHGMPLLKAPVWKDTIAVYFFAGGLAGASAAVAACAQLRGDLPRFVKYGRRVAFGGAVVSAALLIDDLGVRSKFVNMLRVFRPTSPMNVGTWILSAFGATSFAALLPGSIGAASGLAAGVVGLPLAGYTGVLISNTAVPIWSEGRVTLPVLFVASAAASAASLCELVSDSPAERRVARRLAVMSKASELAAHLTYERSVSKVSQPLRQSLLWKGARIGLVASLALSLHPRTRRAAGLLGLAFALATRLAVFHAGKASARDPHATFAIQR